MLSEKLLKGTFIHRKQTKKNKINPPNTKNLNLDKQRTHLILNDTCTTGPCGSRSPGELRSRLSSLHTLGFPLINI